MTKVLNVYLHGVYGGQLFQNRHGNLSFLYDQNYVSNNFPAISVSLPLQEELYEGDKVKAFFSGFLPDDIARHKLARYLGVSDTNAFALLEIVGGECAGALSLYPQEASTLTPPQENIEILTQQRLCEILDLLANRPLLAGYEGLRLSLAGAQSKIAVGLQNNQIALVCGNTPTTHILKPIIEGIEYSVYNELFCMRLAKRVGIDVPHAEIRMAGDTPYYLVERYDRTKDKQGRIVRLHQEDFCQGLGLLPEIKYEREGGPSFKKCNDLLGAVSVTPASDQCKFLERIIFNYLIGNADAHGKNFSLLYQCKKPELAPAYDLLSTAVYPNLSTKMAMKIGDKYDPEDVFLRHWYHLVSDTETARTELKKQLQVLSQNCLEKACALKENLEQEGISSPVFTEICQVVEKRTQYILRDEKRLIEV